MDTFLTLILAGIQVRIGKQNSAGDKEWERLELEIQNLRARIPFASETDTTGMKVTLEMIDELAKIPGDQGVVIRQILR